MYAWGLRDVYVMDSRSLLAKLYLLYCVCICVHNLVKVGAPLCVHVSVSRKRMHSLLALVALLMCSRRGVT